MFSFLEKDRFEARSNNFIEDVLSNAGIENPEMFLNGQLYREEIETTPECLFGMPEAVKIVKDAIMNYRSIGILVDDDADGMTSSAILYKALKHYKARYLQTIFHDQKGHGLSGEIDKIKKGDFDLIIVPDAGSNDFKEHETLLKEGKQLIILDHHEIDKPEKMLELKEKYKGNYVLVNNQLDYNTETNKNFVGAGMAYKFVQAYDKEIGDDYANHVLDLVAVGQTGDASDISDYEIQYLVRLGLDNIKNGLLKEALSERIEKGQKLAPVNLSFGIIPFINAVTRVGTLEEKEELIKGLVGHYPSDSLIEIEKRRKNKETGKFEKRKELWSPYAILMDNLGKIKNRQNKEVDKILKIIKNPFLDGVVIAEIKKDEITYRSITGLIANKLVSKHNMPALVLVENEDGTYSGSARGYEKKFPSFRQWCLDTGKFDLAQGHDNAFGVVIKKDKLDELKEWLTCNDLHDENIVYEVNKLYEGETNLDEVRLINDHAWLFGGRLQTPKFGYKDLVITRNCVSQRGSVVTFFDRGLEFIMYKQEPGLIDEFMSTMGFEQEIVVNLVGSPSRNEWSGRVKEQIVLDDFSMIPLSQSGVKKKEENIWKDETEELVF